MVKDTKEPSSGFIAGICEHVKSEGELHVAQQIKKGESKYEDHKL
jgi:hypothetical protein